jgi:MFS family permease
MAKGTFRSLRIFNYRVWAGGALISNVGTGMQRTAQDWLVLTQLTHHSATAVGVVTGLQFGPQLLLLPWAGYAADRFDRRKLLVATQAAMGLLALVLGLLTVTGLVQLWHVYLLAFLSGCASAMDGPARQTFVSDLVEEVDLPNAVALNSTSITLGLMVGPAAAGVAIGAIGAGWAFLANAVSFAAVIVSLGFLRASELRRHPRAGRARGSLLEGLAYVRSRPDLQAILWMLLLIGAFGLNFQIFIATMSVKVFHGGANQYGVLTSAMSAGTLGGALLAAGRHDPKFRLLLVGAAAFGAGAVLAAIAPNVWLFGAALLVTGVSVLTFTSATSTLMQLTTEPAMRGRVLALRLAIGLGATPVGAPIVGWVADRFGPRWSLGLGAAAGFAAALVALRYMLQQRQLRLLETVEA